MSPSEVRSEDPALRESLLRLDRPTRRLLQLWVGLAALLVSWWASAGLLVPELLRRVHAGWDLPVLSAVMAGRETTPVEAYLHSWDGIAGGVGLLLLVVAILTVPFSLALPRVSRRLSADEESYPLTGGRVGLLWTAATVAVMLAVWALAHLSPVAYVYAVTEDYWIEHGTFVAFMLAGGLFLWAAVLEPGFRTLGPVAFALGAFFVGLEEVSWGQRIIGFETPELLEPHNWQGEMSLHNIWFPKHVVTGSLVILFGVLLPPLASRWGPLGKLLDRLAVPLPGPPLMPLFLVSGALLISARHAPAHFELAEVAEFALGIAVLVLALHLALRAGSGKLPDGRLSLYSGVASLAVVLVLTAILVYRAPSPDGLRWRMNDFAMERYPASGMLQQAQVLFRHMDRNPSWQTPETQLEYGRLLVELGEEHRARRVLEEAIEIQEARLADSPEALADARRIQGEAFSLLGDGIRADEAFQEARVADERALTEAGSQDERGWIHWSLARTASARGDLEAALEHAERACALADERVLHRRIERWAAWRMDDPNDVPVSCRVRIPVR